MRHSAAAGQRTGPIPPAESFVPATTFLEKEILPTSSGGEGENDIRLHPAKAKPQYLLLQPAMPFNRDERLIEPSHHPVR